MRPSRLKRHLFSALLLLLPGMGAAAEGENLFPNPGFETWNTALDLPGDVQWQWTFRDQNLGRKSFSILERSAAEAAGGKYSLHLKDENSGRTVSGFGWRVPQAERHAGKILDFSIRVKQVRAGRPNTVGVLAVALTRGKAVHAEAFVPTAEPTGWETLKLRLALPSDLQGLCLYLMCSHHFHTTAEAYFDDAVLTFRNPESAMKDPVPATVPPTRHTFGNRIRFPQDTPFPWLHEYWGGFDRDAKNTGLYVLKKPTLPQSGIRFRANRPDRLIDLSAFRPDQVKFTLLANRQMHFFANFYSCDSGKIGSRGFRNGKKEKDGFYRYECPLSDFKISKLPTDLSQIFLQFPESQEPGVLEIRECALVLPHPGARVGESVDYRKFLAETGSGKAVYTSDPWTRPELRNGTFYWKGKAMFYLGPLAASHSILRDFSEKANPLGIAHPAYRKEPDAELFRLLGFNTYHLCDILHDKFFTCDFRKERELSRSFNAGLPGVPCVMDMSIGRNPMQDPAREERLQQQNPDWHAYIPFCPEHPDVKRYYSRRCRTEADEALAAGYNVFSYELVNESNYHCFCTFNRRAFAEAMKKKYGTLDKLNSAWGTNLKTFESIAYLPVRDMLETRNEWCEFSAERYIDFLNMMKREIRHVDRRKQVLFTEQLALQNAYSSRGAGMDYRRIADTLDVLTHEGGLRFGNSAARQTGNVMEDAACAENRAYLYVSDLFDALAVPRGKAVMNDEYYCARFDFGKRVPSRRLDMVSAMWSELFHGSSGALLYSWDKRAWEYKDMEGAKRNVINGGYKAYSYLNPWNWPPDQLDFGRQFFEELEPYRERLLPNPRKRGASVALFHNYPSLRMESFGKYSFQQKMFNWHEALLGAQFPLRIVFEEDLEKGLPEEIDALVVPEATFASPETVRAVERFLRKGGQVIADVNAFSRDLHGRSAKSPSGRILRLNATDSRSAESLVRTLEKAGVRRHGALEENGKPLRGPDLQMIDRGDFKMIFLLNLSDTVYRYPVLRLYPKEEKAFYLCDPVRKEILLPPDGETWNRAALAKGVFLPLPPQERVLLTLETQKPAAFRPITETELRRRADAQKQRDARFQAEQNALREQVRKQREEARILRDVRKERCVPLDLSSVANMAFADEVAGDRKGGWFDQGNQDFADMPLGNQLLAGVPFHIPDPSANHGKSTVVLHGSFRPYFPESATGIRVGFPVRRLYFLHTAGWGDKPGTPVLIYRIHYADGSRIDIPVRMKQEINSWGEIEALPHAKIALERTNPAKKHLQCFPWNNPHPEKTIQSIDLVSQKSGAVPAVVAITAERTN